ncbi:MAG: hypothetical protein ACI4KN_02805 [Gemmiger sp.]
MQKIKKLFTRRNLPLLAVLLLELVFLAARFAGDFRTGPVIDIPPERIIPYAEECTNDARGARVENFTGLFAVTRWVDIPRGSYQVSVTYANNGEDGEVRFLDEIMPTARYDAARLPAERTRTVFSLWLPHGCEAAQLQFYADCGEQRVIFITGAQLVPTHSWAYVRLLTGLLFFAVLDLFVLFATHRLPLPIRSVKARYSCVAIACIVIFACMPLGLGYLTYGHDLSIHLSRIEGLKAGLLSGQFPVRMDPALINDKGYPFSLMYSDLFLYPAAFLRILGFSLDSCYKFYVVCITLATALITRWVLRRMLGSEQAALLGSALYTLSFYRLTNVYVRAAVGEYTAMVFLPLVVYGLWRIYTQEKKSDRRGEPWCWMTLAIGFTGLLQSHLLTTELAGLFTLLFCLIRFRQTFTRPVLPALCKAVGAAVLWNLWFLVPLAQYMVTGVCRISGKYDASNLYDTAVYLGQMFTMFGQGGGVAESIQNGMCEEMSQSLGLVLALGAVFLVLALLDTEVRRSGRGIARVGTVTLGFGALAVFCASDLFPWYDLFAAKNGAAQALSKLLGKLQFAWRFLTPATVLLVFAACCGVALFLRTRPEMARRMTAALLVLTVIPAGYLMYDKCYRSQKTVYQSLAAVDDLSGQVGGGEYLPAADPTTDDSAWGCLDPLCSDGTELTGYEKNGLRVTLSLTNPTAENGSVRLPLFSYPGYTMEGGDSGVTLDEKDGYLYVVAEPGWQGTVTVRWKGEWFWRISDCVSLAAIAVTILLRRRRKTAAA